MRTGSSIKELRIICQESRKNKFYNESWFERNFFRRISIYFTKLFLKLGFSASKATILSFFIMILSGIFFTFVSPKYWLVGALMLCLSLIFDRVDGEIARYNKSPSIKGAYLDNITYFAGWPYILTCMSFGIYAIFYNIIVFILGFLAVISFFLLYTSQLLQYKVLHEAGSLAEALKNVKSKKSEKEPYSIIRKSGGLLFQVLGGLIIFLAAIIMDYFIPPITITNMTIVGSLSINARLFWFTLYAITLFTAAIVNIYYSFQSGIRLHRF